MDILDIIRKSYNKFFYPNTPKCSVCNRILINEDKIFCDKCKDKLEWIKGKKCEICSRELSPISYSNLCKSCEENENYFEKGFSLWNYEKYSKRIIKKIKYGGCEGLCLELGKLLYEKTNELDFLLTIDIIIPTPSSKERFKQRGYNQAELVAKGFSKSSNIPLRNDILIKAKETKDQIGLNEKQRKQNLKNAFKVIKEDEIKGKNILIIDDVLTTSSTINEISKILKENKAKNVYFLTLCSKKNTN